MQHACQNALSSLSFILHDGDDLLQLGGGSVALLKDIDGGLVLLLRINAVGNPAQARARLPPPSSFFFFCRLLTNLSNMMSMSSPRHQIHGSIVVSISACHAEDPGSIPGRASSSSLCLHLHPPRYVTSLSLYLFPSISLSSLYHYYLSMSL